ncbi:Thioredoxin domain-containing protein [Emticicia oligotrophica DSM 17448]|uniref:Thioredoxin n=1 Tax=Emticicia oligotrophica (strain DSM 17448 / CIP 109782 / MTCC 6937 / GPTSA100-15) TaxID=929562 RepID=A0ABM5N2Z5_EMTOG|nr:MULTISPECIES: thioredoxin family protein [Emticicia]AFK03804.1 Thioredoxin domain-containing protein [Emticicia oligotrophica DSM 17448]
MTGNFEELVSSDEPVLIDFTAEWCKPCRKIDSMLNQLVEEIDEEVLVMKIDVDKNPALRKKYKIEAVPTLILFQNNKQLWRHTGLISVPEVVKAIDKALY